MGFGEFVKEKRTKAGLSLREFCRLVGLDPSNWSKVERDILPPPKSRKVVKDISSVLLLSEGSEDWHTLFDQAAVGHLPGELLMEPGIAEKIPVFLRSVRGNKLSREELAEILEIFKDM